MKVPLLLLFLIASPSSYYLSTLSLHDALPILSGDHASPPHADPRRRHAEVLDRAVYQLRLVYRRMVREDRRIRVQRLAVSSRQRRDHGGVKAPAQQHGCGVGRSEPPLDRHRKSIM